MIISLRPYSQASTENAPGPRNTTAMLMVSANRAGNPSTRSRVGSGKPDSEMNAMPEAIKKLTRRVRNPVIRKMPTRTARPPTIRTVAPASRVARHSTPCHAAVKPTTDLSSTKPMPADPPGKAENKRFGQNLRVPCLDRKGTRRCQNTACLACPILAEGTFFRTTFEVLD
jgi:hypothetical protein